MLARLDEVSLYPPSSISRDYGRFLDAPAWFTAAELAEAAGSGDPELAAAAAAAGPDGQVTHYLAGVSGLLSRYASLRDVARLITALRAAGAGKAAGIMARRAAGAGMFGVFLAYHPNGTDPGGAVSCRYGCEPDLTPAPPWRWAPRGPGTAGSGPAR